ncbi:MAG: GAF domain-containing protein [Pleurocapsa sp.]
MSELNSKTNPDSFSLQTEGEKLVAAIALRIRQSLQLDVILDRTVREVRQFLQADRVIIYRFEPDWSGTIVVESVISPWKTVLGSKIKDHCFGEHYVEQYTRGRIQVVHDISKVNLTPCHFDLLANFQVQANLVLPIIADEQLWGLLIAQHCQSPRYWNASEVKLLQQLATQVGIAVQQAELYEQIQSLNIYLERKVKKRTAKLQRAFQFEALIRSITEKVRDSLDETQILHTVTQEIGRVLEIEHCKIELYNQDRTIATIAYEYSATSLVCQGNSRQVEDFPELYQQLLQKQSIQFAELIPELNPKTTRVTRLVCPIFDNRGILGNLWLLRPKSEFFDEFEVRLVEQVANQCAIAIRQARLYEQAQVQVEELEKLNTLKDDFLRTISHELRTPMSSIQLASETLEILLAKEIGSNRSATFNKVLEIFRSACQRQNQLVNDLLTLCYIDAKKEILSFKDLELSIWIPQIIEPFYEQIKAQEQQLIVNIPEELPVLRSDISSIKRILSELLNNACKYTPRGENIIVTASAIDNGIKLKVTNTGIEISQREQQKVFEKFYRIPNHDPWQYGGTGIGLALIKKLIELLQGTINLESQEGQTTFILEFYNIQQTALPEEIKQVK